MADLRLSACGTCARALGYELAGWTRPEFDAATLARFDFGHRAEARLKTLLRAEGYTITDEQRPVEWAGVVGHIDGLVTTPEGTTQLLEVKTAGGGSYHFLSTEGCRLASRHWLRAYYAQIMAYAAGLRAEGVEIDAVRLEVGKRDDRAVDPLAAMERCHEVLPFDADEAERVAARLTSVREWRALDGAALAVPPPSLREWTLDDGYLRQPCEMCDYHGLCWRSVQVAGATARARPRWIAGEAMEF